MEKYECMLWWQVKRRDFLEPNKRKDAGMGFFFRKVPKLESVRKIRQKKKESAMKEACIDWCKKLQNSDKAERKKRRMVWCT